jgi:hypothetical protein
LDNIVRCVADRMDWGLHGVPRGWRLDSPAADIRSDFVDLALRGWKTGGLRRKGDERGAYFQRHPLRRHYGQLKPS